MRALLRPRPRARLDAMAPFDPRVDAVWSRARPALRLACVRDAAFYTWRFVHAPSGCEPAFVVLDDDEPIAACALETSPDRGRVHVVDLIAVPDAWHVALAAIARHAAESGATRLDIKLMRTDGQRRRMWRSGFVEREKKPFLVMLPDGGDHRLLDPERWFYGGADSDLDTMTA